MATERLSMRQTREILRQKWRLGRTHREVAQSLGISCGAVGTTVLRARAAGLDWAQVDTLSDEVLQARVYGPPTPPTHHRAVPDGAYLHAERRKPGVTLELLHLEYLEQHPDGYRYTQFCEVYRRWLQRRGLSMRQIYRAGEKCFVDYAGQKPTIIEPTTGEVSRTAWLRRFQGRERDVLDESASVCLGGAGRQCIEAVLPLASAICQHRSGPYQRRRSGCAKGRLA